MQFCLSLTKNNKSEKSSFGYEEGDKKKTLNHRCKCVQVRAHVKKDDGRMQAYGWSLPSKLSHSTSRDLTKSPGKSSKVPVPVPVYCRPLLQDRDDTIKVTILFYIVSNPVLLFRNK